MEHSRFDEIARTLAAPSRRSLLGIAGAAAVAALLGWDDADAKKKKKKGKKPKPCIGGGCVTTVCSPACTSDQHCCDALGFGTPGCWNCCDDQDCADNEVFSGQGKVICRSGGCDCPDDRPALCPAGFGTPGQKCTDPRSDKRNCHPNPLVCGPGCPNHPDHECCDGTCVFLPKCLNNTGGWSECQTPHCGLCGSPCEAEGFGCCNGVCVDMTQDPNCGVCGRNCSEIDQTCDGGTCHVCECEPGQDD